MTSQFLSQCRYSFVRFISIKLISIAYIVLFFFLSSSIFIGYFIPFFFSHNSCGYSFFVYLIISFLLFFQNLLQFIFFSPSKAYLLFFFMAVIIIDIKYCSLSRLTIGMTTYIYYYQGVNNQTNQGSYSSVNLPTMSSLSTIVLDINTST